MTPAGGSTGERTGRRRLLAGIAGVLAGGAAGCLGGDGASGDGASPEPTASATGRDGDAPDGTTTTADATTTDGSTTTSEATTTERTTTTADATTTDATTTTTPGGDLDLREANVTGVEFERRDGEVRFSVTLYHDDDGEDGYANWWQIETPSGDRLGRRDLLHPHGTRAFTRSETIDVPEGTTTVVVRGHDQSHGFGGQAAVVDLRTGEVEFVRQGPEPDSFADREE